MKTAQKTGSPVPLLESAVQLMKDVPKQANDAMALSMIVGYDGNIHANGAIILQVSSVSCVFNNSVDRISVVLLLVNSY